MVRRPESPCVTAGREEQHLARAKLSNTSRCPRSGFTPGEGEEVARGDCHGLTVGRGMREEKDEEGKISFHHIFFFFFKI